MARRQSAKAKASMSQAKIIGYAAGMKRICASAARISTTEGDAIDIYEGSCDEDKNAKLIKKVLDSGHKSFIEHAYFTIAFCNVSAAFEQFLIEFRLASFTIKSRRYVDFGRMGYYVPSDLDPVQLEAYTSHMDYLFSEYNFLIESGIPKEDARFVLPYCFYSNFYCTVNARELIHILRAIRYGHGKGFAEFAHLADSLVDQMKTLFPPFIDEIDFYNYPKDLFLEYTDMQERNNAINPAAHKVTLFASPDNPAESIANAYFRSRGYTQYFHSKGKKYHHDIDMVIQRIMSGKERSRELEQIYYTFLIDDITLSGITHIVRHRMQSILVPTLLRTKTHCYILPRTISSNRKICARYADVFHKTADAVDSLGFFGAQQAHKVYFCLSGNTLDIQTTINARELLVLCKLRCCARAQWEIRAIATEMLAQVRSHFPELFRYFGPSCYVDKHCPEGKLSCGNMAEIARLFSV